mmetsp:Transcript_32961/g.94663  ORF Transcript_32961/g.94663 Transcript_32961/m.94663 type:complete len:262 (-) Transcript_32961:191-976(-)
MTACRESSVRVPFGVRQSPEDFSGEAPRRLSTGEWPARDRRLLPNISSRATASKPSRVCCAGCSPKRTAKGLLACRPAALTPDATESGAVVATEAVPGLCTAQSRAVAGEAVASGPSGGKKRIMAASASGANAGARRSTVPPHMAKAFGFTIRRPKPRAETTLPAAGTAAVSARAARGVRASRRRPDTGDGLSSAMVVSSICGAPGKLGFSDCVKKQSTAKAARPLPNNSATCEVGETDLRLGLRRRPNSSTCASSSPRLS